MEAQLQNAFLYAVYGPAMGRSSAPEHWNNFGEFLLILTKCLLDQQEKARVTVDYIRLREELKLWQFYCRPEMGRLLEMLLLGRGYRQSAFYWEDKQGLGVSRVLLLFLANKNFQAAKEEGFKQIIYLHRHPQVVLTGLLILRTLYLLADQPSLDLNQLTSALKDFLIQLRGEELEALASQALPPKYTLQFEREKILYIQAFDRLAAPTQEELGDSSVSSPSIVQASPDGECRLMFLEALKQYFLLDTGYLKPEEISGSPETQLLVWGFCGLTGRSVQAAVDQLPSGRLVETMAQYLLRLRAYQVNRKPYVPAEKPADLFQLERGAVVKHPILNVIKVLEKNQTPSGIELLLEGKGRCYRFYKKS